MVAAASVLAACSSDSVVAPAAELMVGPSATKVSDAVKKAKGAMESPPDITMTGLKWERQLDEPVVRSFPVTYKRGGKLEIKELGFKIEVPKEAILTDSIMVLVTALEGHTVAYSFEPHGTVFVEPVSIEQSLKGTSWKANKDKGLFSVGYFANDWQINTSSGRAQINEVLPAWLDRDKVFYDIFHFSGYMVSLD